MDYNEIDTISTQDIAEVEVGVELCKSVFVLVDLTGGLEDLLF